MAWEIGPAPNIIAGEIPGSAISVVNPAIPAWGIGPAPSFVAGTVPGSALDSTDPVPVVVLTGTGTAQLLGTGTIDLLAPEIVDFFGVGTAQLVGTGDIIPFDPNAGVLFTGVGELAFDFSGAAQKVLELPGTGSALLLGTGSIEVLSAGEPVVFFSGTGTAALIGTGSLNVVDPNATAPDVKGPVRVVVPDGTVPDVQVKQGDSLPLVVRKLVGADGEGIDLSNATIRVLIARGRSLVVETTAEGEVDGTCTFAPPDTLDAGFYWIEYEITFASGAKLTVPTVGYVRMQVFPDLG